MSNTLSILNRLSAEALLGDSYVVKQIKDLSRSLCYSTEGNQVSFEDYFQRLQDETDKIKSIKLLDRIPENTEHHYQNELIVDLEEILNQCERVLIRLISFQGRIVTAASHVQDLRVGFEAYFMLAASEILDGQKLKLPNKQLAAIAGSEFSRLMERTDIALDTLVEAIKVERLRVAMKKRLANVKFEMGREQVNAAWTNKMPAMLGISPADNVFDLSGDGTNEPEEEFEEEVPAFVSQKATAGLAPRQIPEDAAVPLEEALGEEAALPQPSEDLIRLMNIPQIDITTTTHGPYIAVPYLEVAATLDEGGHAVIKGQGLPEGATVTPTEDAPVLGADGIEPEPEKVTPISKPIFKTGDPVPVTLVEEPIGVCAQVPTEDDPTITVRLSNEMVDAIGVPLVDELDDVTATPFTANQEEAFAKSLEEFDALSKPVETNAVPLVDELDAIMPKKEPVEAKPVAVEPSKPSPAAPQRKKLFFIEDEDIV